MAYNKFLASAIHLGVQTLFKDFVSTRTCFKPYEIMNDHDDN